MTDEDLVLPNVPVGIHVAHGDRGEADLAVKLDLHQHVVVMLHVPHHDVADLVDEDPEEDHTQECPKALSNLAADSLDVREAVSARVVAEVGEFLCHRYVDRRGSIGRRGWRVWLGLLKERAFRFLNAHSGIHSLPFVESLSREIVITS